MKRTLFLVVTIFLPALFQGCAPSMTVVPPSEPEIVDGMVVVRQGWFLMGWDLGDLNERPEHEVFLRTYNIDRYEMSASRFAAFLNEKGNPDDKYFSADQYATIEEKRRADGSIRYAPRKGFERYPANNVSWAGADACCRAMGKRLPTEAEWEKAARGGDGRIYPWGDSPPSRRRASYGRSWDQGGLKALVRVDALSEGDSFYGVRNMAGNVWEWTNDWYRQNYCYTCDDGEEDLLVAAQLAGADPDQLAAEGEEDEDEDKDAPPRKNPTGPSVGNFKVLRGGSWYDSQGESAIRSTYRYWFTPESRSLNTGFRCAR